MVYTRAWNEAIPAGTEVRSLGDDRIKENKGDIRERLATEHTDITVTAGLAELRHNAGRCSVIFYGTTAEIAALTTPPQYAIAYDTTLAMFKYYNGAAWVLAGHSLLHTHQSNAEGGNITGVFKFLAAPTNLVNSAIVYTWTDCDISTLIGADVAKAALLTFSLSVAPGQVAQLKAQVRKNGSTATADLPGVSGGNTWISAGGPPTLVYSGFGIVDLDTSYIFESKFELVSGTIAAAIALRINLTGYIV
jgi:hypothetical protein